MEEELNGLTPLEWKIYRTIRKNSFKPSEEERWTTQRELVDEVNNDLTLNETLEWNGEDYNHCRRLWTIINYINQSGKVPKIIVTRNYQYKLGNKAECEAYFAKLKSDALAKLARISTLERRYKAHGQGQLLDTNLNPINEKSRARDWLESLMPEAVEVLRQEQEKAAKKPRRRSNAETKTATLNRDSSV